ncbi:ABC transporter ATP-binding protein, partial [Candidatus Peregrinibacteria bacterium]|nr:ABC transporter ATP-binding protein [Candidatus Peregrinibacteria bacterium]
MRKILRHYWPEIKHYKWGLILMILGMLAVVACEITTPYFIREFINAIAVIGFNNAGFKSDFNSAGFNDESEIKIIYDLTYLGLIYFGLWIFWRLNEFATTYFQLNVMRDLDDKAFRAIQNQSMRFFESSFTGSLVKKVGRFVNSFENLNDIFYFNFFHQLLIIISIFVIFSYEKPILAIFFILWAVVFIMGSYFFAIWKLKYDIEASEADSKIGATMADSLSSHITVKTFAREDDEQKRFRGVLHYRFKKIRKTWQLQNYANLVQSFFMLFFEFMLFYLGAKWWKEGTLNVGDFIFYQTYLLWLFRELWPFGHNIRRTFEHIANAKEMVDILERHIEIQDVADAKELIITRGKIEFRDVTFGFENEIFFRNFHLVIPPGQRVALVGPSGSGKSTLAKLLFRFFDPQSGMIFLDGQNIKDVTQKSLRRNLSLVPQTPELFHRTLAENIAFGKPEATFDEIRLAAQVAHADEFIEQLPKKYQTYVGERGVKLSGGERQRVAIARAF